MEIQIKAQNREKGVKASSLRKQNLIPAVIYNHGKTDHIQIDGKMFHKLVYNQGVSESTLITLNIDGKEETAFIKDYQIHPVTDAILHVDFFRITYGEKIKTHIPIHLEGVAKGIKEGGVLEVFLSEVEIETLPKFLTDSIKVDLTDLGVGDAVHVNDIIVSEGMHILAEGNPIVCRIAIPAKMVSESAAEEAESEEEKEGEEKNEK